MLNTTYCYVRRDVASGSSVNWNAVNTTLQGIDAAGVGAAVGRNIAMDFRMSQPLMNRVGMAGNVRAISGLGTASKWLGGAGHLGAALNTVLDYQQMQNGQISGARFSYNTLGTGIGVGVGLGFGTIPGAAVGAGFYIGQQMYDGYMYWQQQMSVFLTNFKTGLSNGWVPGR